MIGRVIGFHPHRLTPAWQALARTRWERLQRRICRRLQVTRIWAELQAIDARRLSLRARRELIDADLAQLERQRQAAAWRLASVEGGQPCERDR